jgi:hypothetical protein
MGESVLVIALAVVVILRAMAKLRLRKRIAVPPGHPAERRAALNRAAHRNGDRR